LRRKSKAKGSFVCPGDIRLLLLLVLQLVSTNRFSILEPKCHWGSRMLKRLVEKGRSIIRGKQISPGQQQLPFSFDCRLNQIPEEWHYVAVRFRRANGIRDGNSEGQQQP
jgi:hypothetical protein